MNQYFAYTRVSSPRQGHVGVSLVEQRDAISKFAERSGLSIFRWFEETASGGRRGRRLFQEMMGLLSQGSAAGLIVHKIDRSARNLRDWADLGELIDRGVDVRFAHDDLCLSSRGGRLAADIQAVIAADYIRNLKEEVRKGFFGRLKQGLCPMAAPTGYIDRGPGRVKTLHPQIAPLVLEAFQLYATGEYSIRELRERLYERGLASRRGHVLSPSAMSRLLRNPFYTGTICVRTTGQEFPGVHRPIVSPELYEAVQAQLKNRSVSYPRPKCAPFTYNRLIRCFCGRFLTGERQKSHAYYRCHRCKGVSIREEKLEVAMCSLLQPQEAQLLMGCPPDDRRRLLQSVPITAIYADNRLSFTLGKRSIPQGVRPVFEKSDGAAKPAVA